MATEYDDPQRTIRALQGTLVEQNSQILSLRVEYKKVQEWAMELQQENERLEKELEEAKKPVRNKKVN